MDRHRPSTLPVACAGVHIRPLCVRYGFLGAPAASDIVTAVPGAPLLVEETDEAFQAVLERLHSRGRFGIRLGLGRTRALLRRLGDPHRALSGVLIGGTNGKGSTQALVGAALRVAGYRVGQMPKPHLVSYRERIMVNGQPIGVPEFTALLERVLDDTATVVARHGPPTEFEVLTAASFSWFAQSGVDVGVIEVGLGGRLDATNVWQGGVSAITNVALDHTEQLGPTIAAIAREKARIIKPGDFAAVSGAEQPALGVIRRRATRAHVPLRAVEPWPVVALDLSGTRVRRTDGTEMMIGLLGRHQAANAAIAWSILDALGDAGIATVDVRQREAAFAAARWPGRLELVRRVEAADVLLDGAHNPHGASALAAALDDLAPSLPRGRPIVLLGIVRDKDSGGIVAALKSSRFLANARVITTAVPDTDRATGAADLATLWPGALAIDDPDSALAAATVAAGSGLVIACGSLYLVGYLRARLLGDAALQTNPDT
jgi:dihydrofolate synthase/folylpolyglutamate synthase